MSWRGLKKNSECLIRSELKDKTLKFPKEFVHDRRFLPKVYLNCIGFVGVGLTVIYQQFPVLAMGRFVSPVSVNFA